jgi:hypothetical protein
MIDGEKLNQSFQDPSCSGVRAGDFDRNILVTGTNTR